MRFFVFSCSWSILLLSSFPPLALLSVALCALPARARMHQEKWSGSGLRENLPSPLLHVVYRINRNMRSSLLHSKYLAHSMLSPAHPLVKHVHGRVVEIFSSWDRLIV
ncbi:hypothetical protein B0I35DRAFT_274757 [Stachybotrys elegans]|uniref:Secreted protein n=1 Tax=Stachybotrys elegans TaxID=80388 RepID=A0A8K0SIU2_9HYPO|nr:hypothetical protein B0I35DRAFT_274757 [Stachybotrys elegans]